MTMDNGIGKCGAWASMKQASARTDAFRASLLPAYPAQLLFPLKPRFHCAACEDTGEVDCEACSGFADVGCKVCKGDGRVDCRCTGWECEEDDDEDDA